MKAEDEIQSRYLIGIDLGTTNSAVAYVDTAQGKHEVRDFPIPQLTAPGVVESRATLPSFHYEAAKGEFPAGALRLPWSLEDPDFVVGTLARDHGSSVPGRLVVSAKSWLSHSGVDRTAGLLPWHGASDTQRLSPVQVSARYLSHVRAAWNSHFPDADMTSQEVVLCVPASFDEVARELTLQAARDAGLAHVVLLEEPQAAFYAWIDSQQSNWDKRVKAGQKILVCDVGGGTSDFTLIRVRPATDDSILFHRIAVGEHLILGGDNIDLAIAHYIEKKLSGDRALTPRQWGPLVRSCRQIKETLLGDDAPEKATVHVSAGGSKLIGGSTQIQITREQIVEVVLNGFLPSVELEEISITRRSGFQEFGLPYASDPAITRHLARFLVAHRNSGLEEGQPISGKHDPARPDLVLFNGGLFESPVLRKRLLESISDWFATTTKRPWKPTVLKSDRLDLAVARGAAYFGLVRRGKGTRISGGLAHSYYIGVEGAAAADSPNQNSRSMAVCLLPAGVEEGQSVQMPDRIFNLLIRQPAEFPLYTSSTRTTDAPGALIAVDPLELRAIPPIRTVLQSGKKSAAETVSVRLGAKLTPIGTLDIWCAEVQGDRQWRLQFDVRAATRSDAVVHEGEGESLGIIDDEAIAACSKLILAAFSRGPSSNPQSLVKQLEQASGLSRNDWPPTLMRSFWQTLMEVEAGRQISDVHEARWLNLAGFCLRPGYGLAADDWRIAQTWKLLPSAIIHSRNELCRAEWWILWRRLAGGLGAGQQQTLAEPLIADWRNWIRKGGVNVKGRWPTFQFGAHETAEVWRLLGSLELLPPATKLELGQMLLELLHRNAAPNVREAQLFAIGRMGARVPVYGPLNDLVPIETAQEWAQKLMALDPKEEKSTFAMVQLARLTGDRYRDLPENVRQTIIEWLTHRGAPEHYVQLVREGGQLESQEQRIVFGESLPRGLRIE